MPSLPHSIRDMFPKKTLSFEDLEPGVINVGTIESVYLKQATARPEFRPMRRDPGSPPAEAQADVEPLWMIQFREFRLPVPLRGGRAATIANVLGTEDPHEWIGKKIAFYRAVKQIGGKNVEGLFFDDRPAALDRAGPVGTLFDKTETRKLPDEAIGRFVKLLEGHGKRWDDFLGWCRLNDEVGFAGLYGVALPDVTLGASRLMKKYLDVLATPVLPTAPPAPAKLPDTVKTPERDFNYSTTPRASAQPVIDEADIPF